MDTPLLQRFTLMDNSAPLKLRKLVYLSFFLNELSVK